MKFKNKFILRRKILYFISQRNFSGSLFQLVGTDTQKDLPIIDSYFYFDQFNFTVLANLKEEIGR